MAEVALTRCVCINYKTDIKGHRRVDHVTYLFEFIDDFDVPYRTIMGFMKHIGLVRSTPSIPLDDQSMADADAFTLRSMTGKKSGKIDSDTVTRLQEQDDYNVDWMQSTYNAENHILHLMVSIAKCYRY